MARQLESGAHSVYSLRYRAVFTTNNCREVLTPDHIDLIGSTVEGFADDYGVVIVGIDGERDHVQVDFEAGPTTDLAKFVNVVKGTTARRVRNEYGDELNADLRQDSFWDGSYCLLSAGQASIDTLSQYLQQRRA